MIGQKLYELLTELNASESKTILHYCASSSDKRLSILKTLINQRKKSLEQINRLLSQEIHKHWPKIDQKEHGLKMRRMANYFSEEIEKVLLIDFLGKNKSTRQLLLAEAKAESGNLTLLNTYYNKAYLKAQAEEDALHQVMALKGQIRMGYASQSEKELNKVIELNDQFLKILNQEHEKSISEYYEHLSNIYIEKTALIANKKQKIIQEITVQLNVIKHDIYRASLYLSLAKFFFDSEQYKSYLSLSKKILSSIPVKNHEFAGLERKLIFLELRLNFFSGAKPETLIQISDEIIKDPARFSVINNNTMFYKILSLILKDELSLATHFIQEQHLYFKAEGHVLKDFLQAVIHEKHGEHKKALLLLQPIMYTSNYFFAIFSRLLVIKIQIEKGNDLLAESLIESAYRFLKQNQNHTLGKEGHEYVLKRFKTQLQKKNSKRPETTALPVLSAFHEYLLSTSKYNVLINN